MTFTDDAKRNIEEAQDRAQEVADDTAEKADIAKQRIEGELDKAQGHKITGEAKVQASKLREKMN